MRPKRHWAIVMIVAGLLVLAGYRYINHWAGWVLLAGGLALGSWGWFFHRRRVWIIRLNLLLNQRISVLFNEIDDAKGFLAALTAAKGGNLPMARMS